MLPIKEKLIEPKSSFDRVLSALPCAVLVSPHDDFLSPDELIRSVIPTTLVSLIPIRAPNSAAG